MTRLLALVKHKFFLHSQYGDESDDFLLFSFWFRTSQLMPIILKSARDMCKLVRYVVSYLLRADFNISTGSSSRACTQKITRKHSISFEASSWTSCIVLHRCHHVCQIEPVYHARRSMWLAMRREKSDRWHFKHIRGIVPLLERWLGSSYIFVSRCEMLKWFFTGWVICSLGRNSKGIAKTVTT